MNLPNATQRPARAPAVQPLFAAATAKVTGPNAANATPGTFVLGTPAATAQAPGTNGKDPLQGVRDVFAKVKADAGETLARTGMLRVGMDNAVVSTNPADASAYIKDAAVALDHFDHRLKAAQQFLAQRGLEGRVVGKMVTADIVNLAGMDPVEHVEWQFFLVPQRPGDGWGTPGKVFTGKDTRQLPGLLDEVALETWVGAQGSKSQDASFLRSQDNPLFLGRLNYGTAGSGMYTRVPDYAELGGHKYDTRTVETVVVTTPEAVRNATVAMYQKQPGAYGTNGVCHQGAVLVGRELGVDPVQDVARQVGGLWASRLKFGRSGR